MRAPQLNYGLVATGDDMFDLRKESSAIDFAIQKCLASLEMLRPSLFSGGDGDEARPDGGDNGETLRLLRKHQSAVDEIKITPQKIADKVGA